VENELNLVARDRSWTRANRRDKRCSPKPAESTLHIEVRIRSAPVIGFELRYVEARPPYGVLGTVAGGTLGREKLFSWSDSAVCAGVGKSELRRDLKEMNFHIAHRSSNPPTPAMQSVCPMCRGVHVLGGMAYDVKKVTVEVGELRQL
jgi:hypothetical protein